MMARDVVEAPESLIDEVLDAATEVHRELGPGLLEPAYKGALSHELNIRGIAHRVEVVVPVTYKGVDVGPGFRADVLVDDCLLLELKCVDGITDVHIAQAVNYLRLLGFKRGFILNFKARLMKSGIKRVSI